MTSPAWALLKRELTATLRSTGVFAMLAVVAAICIAIVAILWPSSSVAFSNLGTRAREMFSMFYLANLVAATVLPPGLAALAFSEERRQDTFEPRKSSRCLFRGFLRVDVVKSFAVAVPS